MATRAIANRDPEDASLLAACVTWLAHVRRPAGRSAVARAAQLEPEALGSA